jgi:crossover junction endodeoxyribonuclease RusA
MLAVWKELVRDVCQRAWNRPPLVGPVRLRVTYYCESTRIDGDNLRKPVQDALQGIIYGNDRDVRSGGDRIIDINRALKVRYMSAELALAFSDGRPFVHIEVWDNPDLESVL